MRLLLSFALLLVVGTGCDSTPANGEPTPPTAAAPAPAESEGSSDGEVAQADSAPDDDRYPNLLFELLDPAERTRYVGLAEAELCPCGTVESLDVCLQREEVCELGLQSGALMMRMVKEGAQDVEIADAIQQYIANSRRVWEFELSDTPWIGAENPTVVLVNFSDFECPHCREFADVLHQAVDAYGDSVRVYFKQFPLGNHENAAVASMAALAAHKQGQFAAFHDLVYERQAQLSGADDPALFLYSLAIELGMNTDRFLADVTNTEISDQVNRDRSEGLNAGLMSTPTCFFNGVKMPSEDYSFDALSARIDAQLAAE